MQDYTQEVTRITEEILGELSPSQDMLLIPIVEAVCQIMDGRLKADITNVDCRNAYIPACAMYAASCLRGLDRDDLASFTAGTLSLSFEENSSALTRIADQLMSPFYAAPAIFRGVRA